MVIGVLLATSCTDCDDNVTPITDSNDTTTTTINGANVASSVVVVMETSPTHATSNSNGSNYLVACTGTWNGFGWGQGTSRFYIKFSNIESTVSNKEVLSAKLYLYGKPDDGASDNYGNGNTYYPGSSVQTTNPLYVKRVTGDWAANTINWNNKSNTTDVNQATIAASTSRFENDVVVDVTQLVKDMKTNSAYYGFCVQLQTESPYRFYSFCSESYPNTAKRPWLEITTVE